MEGGGDAVVGEELGAGLGEFGGELEVVDGGGEGGEGEEAGGVDSVEFGECGGDGGLCDGGGGAVEVVELQGPPPGSEEVGGVLLTVDDGFAVEAGWGLAVVCRGGGGGTYTPQCSPLLPERSVSCVPSSMTGFRLSSEAVSTRIRLEVRKPRAAIWML